ncbi:hypothetical protein PS925_00366 [Pseudomonas fluorescens]|uniref:Immunity protein 50 of polymorphic toxin system n=1 Tax=Pseudomonas fluorescens TaxID=294 RepID=A0A5E7S949_PSEFL|nr:Imm50 family immunity protein [Pseudomonas fluorescens]VVP79693.1 hypothetical protein PS925_00366 [Pseudomonas fluorescens]
MIFWNELDGSTFFNKIFSAPVAIGEITLSSIKIDNERPVIIMEFDIAEYPDSPPAKWRESGLNTCRIGINCSNIANLSIKNIPTPDKISLKITKKEKGFNVTACNNESTIKFDTKHILLCGPSAYLNSEE